MSVGYTKKDGSNIRDAAAFRTALGVLTEAEIDALIASAITTLIGGASGSYDTLGEVEAAVGTKAAAVHTHAQSDVTNLVTDLAAKAAGSAVGIDVALFATGGNGTIGNPWTGWDTAITWAARTRYIFRPGYFSFATSPNYLKEGIEIIGMPGSILVHTGTGDAFVMDAVDTWIENASVQNIRVQGTTTALTGTLAISTGSAAVVGTGTSFLTQLAVGNAITFDGGTANATSYIVTAIADNTHLTVGRVATSTASGLAATVCKTRHGFYLRGVRNSCFDRCFARDVAQAGIWTEACVTNSLRLFRCTYADPSGPPFYWLCRPAYGIVTTGRGADWSTCWTIEEPVVERQQVYGIWFKSDSYGNTVINGTSEGHPTPAIGIQIDGTNNTIVNTDVEANASGSDIVINASMNVLLNVFSTGTVSTTTAASYNTFISGRYQNLTIASTGFKNQLLNVFVNGTLTDSGNTTIYTVKTGADYTSSVGIPRPVVSTINAGASMATNVLLGNLFSISTSADCTLLAPTNAVNAFEITYRFDNNSGSTKSITWNAIFQSMTGATLPTTIDHTKTLYVKFRYSSFWTKWQCVSVVGN